MNRVLTLLFSAAAQQVWTPDRDYTLVAVQRNSGNLLVTTDPDSVILDFVSPAANDKRWDVIYMVFSGAPAMPQTEIPILKGTPIFVTASAPSTCQLILNESSSTEPDG
jgi:hypothetical protein